MKALKVAGVYLLIVLLSTICFRFVFFTGYIRLQKHDFRKEAISTNLKEVKKIVLSNEEFDKGKMGYEWKKEKKEIVIQGKYHEVLKITKGNNFYEVLIIPDKIENELFQVFLSHKTDNNSASEGFIFQFLSIAFVESEIDLKINDSFKLISNSFDDLNFQLSNYSSKLIKPPKQAFC